MELPKTINYGEKLRGIICLSNAQKAHRIFNDLLKIMNLPLYKTCAFQSESELQDKWYVARHDRSVPNIVAMMCWESGIIFAHLGQMDVYNDHNAPYGDPTLIDISDEIFYVSKANFIESRVDKLKLIKSSIDGDSGYYYAKQQPYSERKLILAGLRRFINCEFASLSISRDYEKKYNKVTGKEHFTALFDKFKYVYKNKFPDGDIILHLNDIEYILLTIFNIDFHAFSCKTESPKIIEHERVFEGPYKPQLIMCGRSIRREAGIYVTWKNIFDFGEPKWSNKPFEKIDVFPRAFHINDKCSCYELCGGVMKNDNGTLCMLTIGQFDKIPAKLCARMFVWFYKKVHYCATESPLFIFNRVLNDWLMDVTLNGKTLREHGSLEIKGFSHVLYNKKNASMYNIFKTLKTHVGNIADKSKKTIDIISPNICTLEYTIEMFNIIHTFTNIDVSKNRYNIPGPFISAMDFSKRLSELFLEI